MLVVLLVNARVYSQIVERINMMFPPRIIRQRLFIRFLARTVLIMLISITSACESLRYYQHVAQGHFQLLWGRQSVTTLIARTDTDPVLRERLILLEKIRDFASQELKLPDNNSYRSYVDVGRPHVVWNVFAAPVLQIEAKKKCYPIAGCVAYRGYFEPQQAQHYAAGLMAQGYDSVVVPVSAYSTLGWFDDPALNTFIYREDMYLAGLIFHELAHQQLYLAGDTAFSESFARAVEVEGVKLWLHAYYPQNLERLQTYLYDQRMADEFSQTLLTLRRQLDNVYQSDLPEVAKLQQKQQLFTHYQRVEYASFKQQWSTNRFDNWVYTDFNNAKLVPVASYYSWQAQFQALLAESTSWTNFFDRVKTLSQLTKNQREQQLQALLK